MHHWIFIQRLARTEFSRGTLAILACSSSPDEAVKKATHAHIAMSMMVPMPKKLDHGERKGMQPRSEFWRSSKLKTGMRCIGHYRKKLADILSPEESSRDF